MLQTMKMPHDRGRKGRGFGTGGTAVVRWAASFVGLFGAIVNSHLATNSYGDVDNDTRSRSRSDGVAVRGCRCAVLYSGHVRSFVRPQVHLSQMMNLIEPLETECEVDVFMYLSVEDQVPRRQGMGKFADELAFAPHSPQQSEVDAALRLFNPVSVEFHQEQAGYIPNRCETGCERNAFWQLYKMQAVYRIMENHEAKRGFQYTWIIRSRLDIGWMLPMVPLSRFPPTRVYAGHNFFPLADQFLLVPRQFAPAVFGTVSLCYSCDVLESQRESRIPAQTETFLRLAMRRAGVPFGYYEFPIVIVRNSEGGVCGVVHAHKLTCQLLLSTGLIGYETTTAAAAAAAAAAATVSGGGVIGCAEAVNAWHRGACLEMFPPLSQGSSGPKSSPPKETTNANDELDADTEDVNNREEGGSRGIGGNAGRGDDAVMVSFEEATGRLHGIRRILRELGEAIRIHPTPRRDPSSFFMAHHYPFHQSNGGPRDQIAVVAGFRLSEAVFNQFALSFACLLSEAGREEREETEEEEEEDDDDGRTGRAAAGKIDRDRRDSHHADSSPTGVSFDDVVGARTEAEPTTPVHNVASAGSINSSTGTRGTAEALLLLKTTAERGDLRAEVNCLLVDSMHDLWMELLEQELEPSEPICRGDAGQCLEREIARAVRAGSRSSQLA